MRTRRDSSAGPDRLLRRATAEFIEPMLATTTEERNLPGPPGTWIFERKFDGFRALAIRNGAHVHLLSRNRKELGQNYPEIVTALDAQPVRQFVLDGEIVGMRNRQIRFEYLQQRLKPPDLPEAGRSGVSVAYYVFDLLQANGMDVRALPLLERKRLLKKAIEFGGPIRYAPHRLGSSRGAFEQACRNGWEGIIAKHADAPYVSGRGKIWLKLKCRDRQEFVIGGFSDPQGSRIVLGAILIGYFENGVLKYAGKVGAGFDTRTLEMLGERLKPLLVPTCPFAPDPDLPRRNVHWVKPKLVAEIEFAEWTRDGKLRHPHFLGLRPDKTPSEVVRERPAAIARLT
jgi:bifunctional non-homologous end joining protein LigD